MCFHTSRNRGASLCRVHTSSHTVCKPCVSVDYVVDCCSAFIKYTQTKVQYIVPLDMKGCICHFTKTGNRTPNSGVKGGGADHYPRAPALLWNDKNGLFLQKSFPLQCIRREFTGEKPTSPTLKNTFSR